MISAKTLETRNDADARFVWKVRFARALYDRKQSRSEIDELLLFIDWIMGLPKPLEDQFATEWREIERKTNRAQSMPPLVRCAQKEGIAIGEHIWKRETLSRQMHTKFGPTPADIQSKLDDMADTNRFRHRDRANVAENSTDFVLVRQRLTNRSLLCILPAKRGAAAIVTSQNKTGAGNCPKPNGDWPRGTHYPIAS